MHLVGDGLSVQQNILPRIASGSNEVFLLSRWGIWVSLAMDEQVARAAAARQPSSRAESVMLLSVILAILVSLLCLIVIVAMLPRAGATVVSWIPGV